MVNSTPPLEDEECYTLAEYLDVLRTQKKVKVYTHTANETYTKSWKQKTRNKRMGVRPGIPDYIIVFDDKVLFLEMKRVKGGTVTGFQRKWLKELPGKQTMAAVCYGFDDAKKVIDLVIGGK